MIERTEEYEVESNLGHRKRGKDFQWLYLFKNSPNHESRCQSTCDIVEMDWIVTKEIHKYIVWNHLLPDLNQLLIFHIIIFEDENKRGSKYFNKKFHLEGIFWKVFSADR